MATSILGYTHAFVGPTQVTPSIFERLFHGTNLHKPSDVRQSKGLPARGSDLDLVHHVQQASNGTASAFRGTTQLFCSPDGEAGAALWGDWVYEVTLYPGYELNSLLEGRVRLFNGLFGGNPMYGEQEVAIPAEVPLARIECVARVVSGDRGKRPAYLADWSPE